MRSSFGSGTFSRSSKYVIALSRMERRPLVRMKIECCSYWWMEIFLAVDSSVPLVMRVSAIASRPPWHFIPRQKVMDAPGLRPARRLRRTGGGDAYLGRPLLRARAHVDAPERRNVIVV